MYISLYGKIQYIVNVKFQIAGVRVFQYFHYNGFSDVPFEAESFINLSVSSLHTILVPFAGLLYPIYSRQQQD